MAWPLIESICTKVDHGANVILENGSALPRKTLHPDPVSRQPLSVRAAEGSPGLLLDNGQRVDAEPAGFQHLGRLRAN